MEHIQSISHRAGEIQDTTSHSWAWRLVYSIRTVNFWEAAWMKKDTEAIMTCNKMISNDCLHL